MVVFQDIEDVQEWLGPMDYAAFWEAMKSYGATDEDREHYDRLIASGGVEADRLLSGLKILATMDLKTAFNLKSRMPDLSSKSIN